MNRGTCTGRWRSECFLINCDFTEQGAGATLSITGIAVTNGVVSITVQLERKAPLGAINGVLNFYGANDLAAGFSRSPIAKESISSVQAIRPSPPPRTQAWSRSPLPPPSA